MIRYDTYYYLLGPAVLSIHQFPFSRYLVCIMVDCQRTTEFTHELYLSVRLTHIELPRFPWKLHIMLDAMDRTGDKSVVCWQPHGRAFMVHKPKEFVQQVMTHFFNQTKYASFQRQLNLYGFSRLTHGPDKGAYYHGCFVRGERNLCRGMIRQKIKGTKVRRSLAPDEEPNFYSARYNNTVEMPALSPEEAPSSRNAKRQSSLVTPDQSPRMLTIKAHGIASADSLVSLLPSIAAPVTPFQETSSKSSNVKATQKPSSSSVPSIPRTVSPHQSFSTAYRLNAVPTTQTSIAVKGGDLLFFEGQPFRYLEHLEELPPAPFFQTNYLPAPSPFIQRDSNDTDHDKIRNVVCRDPPSCQQSEHPLNVCSS